MKSLTNHLLTLLLLASCVSREKEMEGYWEGETELNNQKARIGLELEKDSVDYITHIIIPAYGWKFSFPGSKIANDSIIVGSWRAHYDRKEGVIRGTVPKFLLPKYDVDFALSKSEKIELPENEPLPSTREPDHTLDISSPIWSNMVSDGRLLYFGTTDSLFHCIDPAKGTTLWTKKVNGEVRGEAGLYNSHSLIFYSDAGTLYSLNLQGDENWRQALAVDSIERRAFDYDYYSAAPLIVDDRIYFGNGSGKMYCINAEDGSIIWSYQTNGPIRTKAALLEDQLIFGSFDGSIYSLDQIGNLNWKYEVGYPLVGGVTVVNDLAILGSRSQELLAIDKHGAVRWSNYFWYSWVESTPVLHNDTLYIGSSDSQKISSINPKNGELIWEFDTGGCPWPTPFVTDDYVIISALGNDAYFHKHFSYAIGLDRKTGQELWRHTIEEKEEHYYGYASAPVQVGNTIWIPTTSGRIAGFDLAEPM